MVRIPTYASYMNLMNQTMNNKAQLDLYAFQTNTGLKSPTYSGYGMSAFSIVNLEASQAVVSNFLENNKVLGVEINTMNTSMQSLNKSVSEYKSMLNSFSGMDVEKLSPDYTGGEINFSSNNDVYQGKTITLDGVKYTFANDGTGNNIDISGLTPGSATYAEDVMNALKDKVEATNPDFKFEGTKFTFPLYTVNGSSSVLNADGVTTGEPYTMSSEQNQNLKQLQQQAFATMQMLADCLNVSANGKYLFGGGNSDQAPVNFPFKSLEEFQAYYDGVNIKYPTESGANLANRTVTAKETGAITLERTNGNNGTIKAANAGGFLTEAVKANASTTGDLTFDTDKNTVKATQYGAFNTIKAGDTLVLKGANGNNGAYTVKSVSEDGKTITFEDSTPLAADATIADGGGVSFNTSFPVGAVIDMNGFNDKNIASTVQVTGISPDGTTLYVTADPSRFPDPAKTIPASSQWSLESNSYYEGGSLISERRISENQSINMDINASNPAFEKLFRALGEIAQGNVVDTRNPADDFDGLINENKAANIIEQGVKLLQSAVDNSGNPNGGLNDDLNTVTAKLSANSVVLKNNNENLTLVNNNLEDSVASLKKVDQTEAAIKALLALNNLNASYSIMQNVMSTSLLNYLK